MKTKIITLSTTVMLGMGSLLAIPSVKAESIDKESAEIKSSIDQTLKELSSLQTQRADIEAQIARIEQAVNDNHAKIDETNKQITETNAEIETLKKDIAVIEERIAQRTEVLKGRAVSFQENGGQVSYVEVILGSSSFGDFIDRVGAVATIVEADKDLIADQEADKKVIEEKQASVEEKLTDLNNTMVELEGMQAQITEQKAESELLKAQLTQQENESNTELASLRERDEALAAQKAELLVAAQVSETTTDSKTTIASNTPESKVESETTNTNTKTSTSTNTKTNTKTNTNTSTNAVSGNLSSVINAGNKYIGNSVYVFGGGRTASDIAAGRFDCSGFVSWAFSQAGVSVGASTDSLKNTGTRVSTNEMRPGDMVFFNTYKTDGHVGIYLGGGKFIGSQSSTGVAVANMSSGYWADHFNGRVMRVMN
ncbi:MAG TPA: NlpC/P60 family protein [Bacillus sp. (in: firmicutes)]